MMGVVREKRAINFMQPNVYEVKHIFNSNN